MKGVQAWNYEHFHRTCRVASRENVLILDVAGFKYVGCNRCGVLCNLDAIAQKFQTYAEASQSLPSPQIPPEEVAPV